MKITKSQLKQIIKEELQSVLKENSEVLDMIKLKLGLEYKNIPADPGKLIAMAQTIEEEFPEYGMDDWKHGAWGADRLPLELEQRLGITRVARHAGDTGAAAAERAAWLKSKEAPPVSRASMEDDPTRKSAAEYAARSGGFNPYGDPVDWKVPGG